MNDCDFVIDGPGEETNTPLRPEEPTGWEVVVFEVEDAT